MQVDGIIKEFLLECTIKGFSPRTIKSYRNNLCRFVSLSETEELAALTSARIKQTISIFQENDLKATYINSQIKTLRAFFVYVTQQEYIAVNPMKKVPWCKEKMPLIATFTDNEVKGMLEAYSELTFMEMRNKAILAMLFDTGIRCLELCFLTQSDISDTHITIMGKGGKERIAAVSPKLHRILFKYNRMRDCYFSGKDFVADNLFLSRTGKQLTNTAVERIVRIAGEKAEIDDKLRCSPHTCRHYFA